MGKPKLGFHAQIKRDATLTAVVKVLELSRETPGIPIDHWAEILLAWSHAEYAEPPLPKPAIALTAAKVLELYETRAANGLALFHPADQLDVPGFGREMTRSAGEKAKEIGWVQAQDANTEDSDDEFESDQFHRRRAQ